jgi:MFS family permease
LAAFVSVLNVSIVYLALPNMRHSLHAGISDQQWIVSIYPLMEGSFTLAAGTIGDQFGRKRILGLSVGLFVLASIACALSRDPVQLIAARAAQGIGGAALLSLPLALLLETVRDSKASDSTIALYSTVAALAAGFAPLAGGALVQWIGWPAIFYLSAALGLIVIAGLFFATEKTPHVVTGWDLWGQLLSIAAIVAISYAMIEGNQSGWSSPVILTAFGIAGAGFALFLAVERYAKWPMIHLRYFKLRAFNVAVLLLGIVNFAWYGVMLLVSLFMQDIQGLSEIAAGLYLIPCNAAYFAANFFSNQLREKLGFPWNIAISFIFSIAGIVWLAAADQKTPPWEVSAALALAGLGWGIICTPASAVGLSVVESSDEGFASGTLAFGRSLFGVFGIAVLGSLLSAGMSGRIAERMSKLHASQQAIAQTARAVVHGDLFAVAHRYSPLVHKSFVHAMHDALLVCAALSVAVVIAIMIALSARGRSLPQS